MPNREMVATISALLRMVSPVSNITKLGSPFVLTTIPYSILY
jgi:hypothetical protein